MILQIEFKHRQQCNRFAKLIQKDKLMSKYYEFKTGGCIWLKFENKESRERVKDVLMKNIKCEIMLRDSGIDYLFIK